MKTILFALAICSVLSFGPVRNSHALMIFDGSRLVGAMVKSRDGVVLGTISDLVITSPGYVDFAIVEQAMPLTSEGDYWPGHIVAVPLSALSISKGESQGVQVVLNADKEKFYEAPDAPPSFFQNGGHINLHDVTQLERYFGVGSYWTYPYWGYID